MRYIILKLVAPALCILPTGLVWADEPIQVATTAQVEKIEPGPNGTPQVRLVPAETVVPGTEVVYTITVQNKGSEPARDVVVDNPVPNHSEFVSGSALAPGSAVSFSVDGGKSYGAAELLRVRDAAGMERPARVDDYTNIRFVFLPVIAPGQSVMARFRAVVK